VGYTSTRGDIVRIVGTTGPAKKWWQERPGHWHKTLEEALASADSDRVAVAWAIIRYEGGSHGDIAEAARKAGLARSTLHAIVNGERPRGVSQRVKRALAKAFSIELEDLVARHPLAVGNAPVVVEPGDQRWPAYWELLRQEPGAPRRPTAEQWMRDRPDLFPNAVTEAVTPS